MRLAQQRVCAESRGCLQRAALTVAAKAEQHSIGLREVNLTLESAAQCRKKFFESACAHLGARLRMQKRELSSLAETDTNLRNTIKTSAHHPTAMAPLCSDSSHARG
jgi:hypothetical protein